MSHAVFIQNPKSIYDDIPGQVYHFPKRYLTAVEKTVGDWIVLYEGRQGAFGYTAIQKITGIREDLGKAGHYFADVEPGSLFEFETLVSRQDSNGLAYEKVLRRPDGTPMSGGQSVSAVRKLSSAEFEAIVDAGFSKINDAAAIPRSDFTALGQEGFQFSEPAVPFEYGGPEQGRDTILTSRAKRDPAFSRMVRRAYGNRCAISGLELSNGGGRPEVEAAHIQPVKDGGPDIIINGIALSGTVHWMFDRGLITIAEDYSIIVSHNKVPSDTANRLIMGRRKMILPKQQRHHPHPTFLKFHRERVFGQQVG